MGISGGAGCGPRGTPRGGGRATAESERTIRYKATTRAERATSGVGAKIGSSRVVDTHKTRDKVGFALVFFGAGQRKPVR